MEEISSYQMILQNRKDEKDGFMNIWQLSEQERESHNLSHKEKTVKINISDVFMIKEDEKNQRKWKIAIIDSIFMGKETADLVTFTEEIRNGKIHFLCSAIQLLCNYHQQSR